MNSKAKLSNDPNAAIQMNASQIALIGMHFALGAKNQRSLCRHNDQNSACDVCNTCANILLFFSVTAGISAHSIQNGKWEELQKVLVAFAKDNFPDFPAEAFENKSAEEWAEFLDDKG